MKPGNGGATEDIRKAVWAGFADHYEVAPSQLQESMKARELAEVMDIADNITERVVDHILTHYCRRSP